MSDITLWPIIDIVPYVLLLLASQLFLSRIASKSFRMIAYVAMNSLLAVSTRLPVHSKVVGKLEALRDAVCRR